MRVPWMALALCALVDVSPLSWAAAESEAPSWEESAAIAAALAADPGLVALDLSLRRWEGLIEQAGIAPSPSLEVELEEFAGTGDVGALESAVTTLRYSQLIEGGGKRAGRIALVEAERDLAAAERAIREREVTTAVREAFLEVLLAREHAALAGELVALAQETAGVVAARIEAGHAAPLEGSRARIALTTVELEAQAARSELAAAWARLTVLIPTLSGSPQALQGSLEQLAPPAGIEGLLAQLESHPELQRLTYERARRAAVLDAERTLSARDLAWSGGVQHSQESDEFALVASVEFDLGGRSRNRGAIAAAEADLAALDAEAETLRAALRAELEAAYPTLVAAYDEVSVLQREVLPTADEVLLLTQEAYRVGKVGIVEVLDAQSALVDVRAQYLDALSRFHRTARAIDALTGGSGVHS